MIAQRDAPILHFSTGSKFTAGTHGFIELGTLVYETTLQRLRDAHFTACSVCAYHEVSRAVSSQVAPSAPRSRLARGRGPPSVVLSCKNRKMNSHPYSSTGPRKQIVSPFDASMGQRNLTL